jgi:hypothetical protein
MNDDLYEIIHIILFTISFLGLINIKQYGQKLSIIYLLLFVLIIPISWLCSEYINFLVSDIISIVCYSVLSFIALKFKFNQVKNHQNG